MNGAANPELRLLADDITEKALYVEARSYLPEDLQPKVDVASMMSALEVRSPFTVLQGTDRLGLQPIVVGRYVDRPRRIDDRWRFVHRTMIPERWGDTGDHLSFDPR